MSASLSDADHGILCLQAWEGLTAEEMATTLEISVPAAWKRLQRARDRLAARWEATDDGGHVATWPATAGRDLP